MNADTGHLYHNLVAAKHAEEDGENVVYFDAETEEEAKQVAERHKSFIREMFGAPTSPMEFARRLK